MDPQVLNLIKEINRLWEGVYPYLAAHIHEVYGRSNGTVIEIGPFCGVLLDLAGRRWGSSFLMGTFPSGMGLFLREEAERRGLAHALGIVETDPSLSALAAGTVDLAIYRGALFFPSLFQTDFRAIDRILKPGGTAFVGGGFGKDTPPSVINAIADQSRRLNLALGKVTVTKEEVEWALRNAAITADITITFNGGFWVIMQKPRTLARVEPVK